MVGTGGIGKNEALSGSGMYHDTAVNRKKEHDDDAYKYLGQRGPGDCFKRRGFIKCSERLNYFLLTIKPMNPHFQLTCILKRILIKLPLMVPNYFL